MAGTTIPLITLREFDFTSVAAGNTASVVLVKALDVSEWTRGVVVFRLHENQSDGATRSVGIKLEAIAPCPDDPSQDFVASTPLSASFDGTESAPAIKDIVVDYRHTKLGMGHLRVSVTGAQDPSSGGTVKAKISADLVVRDW